MAEVKGRQFNAEGKEDKRDYPFTDFAEWASGDEESVRPKRKFKVQNQKNTPACFEWSTKVLMWDYSYKKIMDIKKWDFILNSWWIDEVVDVIEKQADSLVDIKTYKTRWWLWNIRCTKDHTFFVYENNEIIEKKAGDIKRWNFVIEAIQDIKEQDVEKIDILDYISHDIYMTDDWLYLYNKQWNQKYAIPRYINIDDSFLKLCWYYLAEWNLIYSSWNINGIMFTFHRKEKEYHDEVIESLKKIYNWISYSIYDKWDNATTIEVYSSIIWHLFKNIFNSLCFNKDIPDFIYNLPYKKFKVLLSRLIYWDWYITIRSALEIWLSLTADKLINKIKNKLYNEWIWCSYEIRNNSSSTQKRKDIYWLYFYWKDVVDLLPEESEWITPRPLSNNQIQFFIRDWKKYVAKKVVSINTEDIYTPVYDLSIKDKHEYIVNWILVHNCTMYSACHISNWQNILEDKRLWVKREQVDPLWPWNEFCAERGNYNNWAAIQTIALRHKKKGFIEGFVTISRQTDELTQSRQMKQAIDMWCFLSSGSAFWDRATIKKTGMFSERTDGVFTWHAYCFVDYVLDGDGEVEYFWAVNSWWDTWGIHKGYFKVYRNQLMNHYSKLVFIDKDDSRNFANFEEIQKIKQAIAILRDVYHNTKKEEVQRYLEKVQFWQSFSDIYWTII